MNRNHRASGTAAAALAALIVLIPLSGAAETIRIGTEGRYPPFNAIDSSGEFYGFDIDIANALCEKLDATCEFVAQDWDGIIPALLAGKYDVIVASMFITEERRKIVDFTEPYYAAAMTYVAPKEAGITETDDAALAGKVIGVQTSTTQADYAAAEHPSAEIRQYRTQDEVNLDLASGRLDLQIGDLVPMLDWTEKSDDGACCELVGKPITDPAYVGEGVAMALRQDDDELRERIDAALEEMVADGTYETINDKYFSLDIHDME